MGNRIEVEDLESGPEEVAKVGGSGDLAGKALTVEC
jgi:hypothetical protein